MIKKIFILIVILLILLFFLSCTVNDFTGLIKVENHTDTELRNVKIGDTLITSYVAPGNYVDYWFAYTISGKITTEGVEVNEYQDDTNFKLQPGYWIFITAQSYGHDMEEQVEISVRKQGSEQDENWHD